MNPDRFSRPHRYCGGRRSRGLGRICFEGTVGNAQDPNLVECWLGIAYIVVMAESESPTSQQANPSADQELSILTEIGQILSSTLELRDAFGENDANHFRQAGYAPRDAGPAGRVHRPPAHRSGSRADARRNRARQICARRGDHRQRRRDRPAAHHRRPAERARLPEPHRPAQRADGDAADQLHLRPDQDRGPDGRCAVGRQAVRQRRAAPQRPPLPRHHRRVPRAGDPDQPHGDAAEGRAAGGKRPAPRQVRDRYRFENIIGDSPGDARSLRHRRAGRQQPRDRAAARRDRHRQGDDRQGDPLQLAAARTSRSSASTAAR